jgi:hypothetical protein
MVAIIFIYFIYKYRVINSVVMDIYIKQNIYSMHIITAVLCLLCSAVLTG